jgi:hypothetical protein
MIPAFAIITATAILPAQEPQNHDEPASQPADSEEHDAHSAESEAPEEAEQPLPRREPSAAEILRELNKQVDTPPRPVIRPTAPPQLIRKTVGAEVLPENRVAPVMRKLLPDGYRIVDRPGRLTREGDYYTYSFESRGQGMEELPMRLLPNRLLEDMESFSAGGTRAVVFVISGEVTEYHGVNYLLVQKLLTRPNLGNIK